MKPHTYTNRSLCECELYELANYDNDPQMKEVMQQFEVRTSQRFHEYDESLQSKRKQCKDQCDKEIQKIILKDKLEKQMAQQLTTLETKINTDDIPTCICEKSLADKVEKTCLNCGKNLGGFVPGLGLIGGSALYVAAVKSSVELGIKMGMQSVISNLKGLWGLPRLIDATVIKNFVTPINYCNKTSIIEFLNNINNSSCASQSEIPQLFCHMVSRPGGEEELAKRVADIAEIAQETGAEAASGKFAQMTSVSAIFSDPVIISAIVVVCIAVILLIIYLILRYRRKKKMNKKLQYIKLLKE
ncbi:hypothetical protein PFFVO_01587 [Plasmodium falciparum Vietnam Oak-Knoll (FVO)]|uniref:Surface antigen n=1 Tax=Plasmodium falciparum Vietnam Oak-Knoll (FVO) TaxID=1036723 RepID=A0A024VB18_PLAFA|nr:hypothetical protein PFFVO_01587 [Plasmodium falciparum Vietnam Oak-Knoll (FVO)]